MKKLRKRKIKGSQVKPRLRIFKSNKNFYAQVINDDQNKTLFSSSNLKMSQKGSKSLELIATNLFNSLKNANIEKLVFDRGSYQYNGNIKTFIEILKKNGVKI